MSFLRKAWFFNLFCFLLLIFYAYCFVDSVSPYWFNPQWTTDDALQQVFPFHKVNYPDLFAGDLITDVMEGYLAPLHYYLSWFVTELTADPIMMSHWLTLMQYVLSLLFVFLLVKHFTAFAPACFAVVWLLHTRTFMQRITGGLPRGWSPVLIAAFLYFLAKEKHKTVLFVLLCGCLLNPPATIICAVTYGLYLSCSLLIKRDRIALKNLLILILLSPLYILITYKVVERPESVGQMVTYEQALEMPSMNRPDGRFPFVPLLDYKQEVTMFGFQPFRHRLAKLDSFQKAYLAPVVKFFRANGITIFLLAIATLLLVNLMKSKQVLPLVLFCYFLAVVSVYFLSRVLAFNLYVPNRHLQQPLSIFWVAAFVVLLWQVFARVKTTSLVKSVYAYSPRHFVIFIITAVMIYFCNGHGFFGTANFNYSLYKKGKVFAWLKKNTPQDSVIAGHPQHIDATMLFAERQAYATYETAHPFYPKYFKEMLRRHQISLQAHYAKDLSEVYQLLKDEGVDYFVFNKSRFYPDALAKEDYFEPLNGLVQDLTSRHYNEYAYKQIPRQVDRVKTPYLLFRDEQSVIIDLKKLGEFLNVA